MLEPRAKRDAFDPRVGSLNADGQFTQNKAEDCGGGL